MNIENIKNSLCDELQTSKGTRAATMLDNIMRLETLTKEMNSLQDKFKPLHNEYQQIMQYFRVQKQRKHINKSEYDMIANMFENKRTHIIKKLK